MEAPPVDAGAAARHRLGSLWSPVGLGFLSLVPVALVLLAQLLQIGLGTTIASTMPVSDTNVWSGCASALAHLSTPENLDWCLKRPLTMFLQAPLFIAAPTSMGAVVVLQTLVLCGLLWWFLVTLTGTLPVNRWAMWVTYLAALWPVVFYGTQLGTESPALALSLVSATAILRLLTTGRVLWGFLSGATALLAFQMRPGNIVLTLAIVLAVLVLTWRQARSWVRTGATLIGFGLVWWLPDALLRAAGWPEAGHSSNFWSVLYSAASPASDTWEAAYVRYAQDVGCSTDWTPDPCMGLESFEFANNQRDAALQQMANNPLAIPRQAVTNTVTMLDTGFLNQAWMHQFPPFWKIGAIPGLLEGGNLIGVVLATLLWVASWVLLGALVVGLVLLWRRRDWQAARLADFGQRDLRRLQVSLALGLVTIAGAIAFYALVGHDEPQRHLVQNIPFVLLAIAAALTIFLRPRRASGAVPTARTREPAWTRITLSAVVLVIAATAVVEGHRSGESFLVARSCTDATKPVQEYTVMSKARWNATTQVAGPSDWRVLQGESTRSFPTDRSWTQLQINSLAPGNLMTLRAVDTGELVPVHLSDAADAAHTAAGAGSVMCTRPAEAPGVMIVFDLVPRA